MVTTTLSPRLNPEVRRIAAEIVCEDFGLIPSPELISVVTPRPREKFISGGWQAGKSVSSALDVWLDIIFLEPIGRDFLYWIIVPNYKAPHKEFDYLKEWAEKKGILASSHVPEGSSCKLTLKTELGLTIVVETKTGEDIPNIAGEPCDGVVVAEAGQMPSAVRDQVQGRIITRHGWITFSGTLEDDENKPRWVWYGDIITALRALPAYGEAEAYSLPSWANLAAFPEGESDPEIERQRQKLPPDVFARKIAGLPIGVPYPVYKQLHLPGVNLLPWLSPAWDGDLSQHPFHFDCSERPDLVWVYAKGAGGHDYGESYGHPSTLVPVTVTTKNVAVVRDGWGHLTSDDAAIETERRLMSQKYHIPLRRWGFDPLQKEAAKIRRVTPVPSGAGSRLSRVGLVQERITQDHLRFDLTQPGAREVFAQMLRVHFIKKVVAGRGEVYDYDRDDDDLAAAVENAVYVMAQPYIDLAGTSMPAEIGAPV